MSRNPEAAGESCGQTLGLPSDEVHLWLANPDEVAEADLTRCRVVLCPEEQDRLRRFSLPRLQHAFLVTRALVRDVLSRYAPIRPDGWRFTANAYGRPEIAAPADLNWLRFNLSHTDGLIVCAVARDCEIGVDVENAGRRWSGVALADRFFAPAESAELHALPFELQRGRFFDYWTLKEAYIKARGMGLAIPLDQFWFRLAAERPPEIEFSPQMVDEPATWQFVQSRPTPRHRLAVAVRRSPGQQLRIVTRGIRPLA